MDTEGRSIKRSTTKKEVLKFCKDGIESHVPIVVWLPKYKFKEYFPSDLVAGITVGCLHVPQGLAFATLAKASPIFGLYTSCFSVFVYCFFGSAVISSFGPVAVASILTGEAVSNHPHSEFTNNELVVVITFLVGITYLIGYALRFAVITKLFTKTFTASFVLACSIQIVIKSLKVVLGITTQDERGYFSLGYNLYNTFKEINQVNFITLGISMCVLIVFAFNTLVIRPQMSRCTKFVLPVEVMVMAIVALLSHTLDFKGKGVKVVGFVPTGLPTPQLPNFRAVPEIWLEAVIISVVNFATTISMTMMFNKELRPNQELFALSITNIICCTMQTLPFGNSMMRTVIAKSCGIKTLLCSMLSSVFIMMVILFMGPLFEPLPSCVLGCVILYGLSVLIITKAKEAPAVFKSGVENSIIWLATLLATLFITIQLGLLVGFILTLRQFLAHQSLDENGKGKTNGDVKEGPEQQQLLNRTPGGTGRTV